ncbi:SPFH domain-containing protein [bacterium]|nr:SPFH domain-containing protein [bacterium]
MGLWDKLRGELIDIIEWNQPSESDLMAWRFPRRDNEIKNGAKLIVREGQSAIFVNMGQLGDIFNPGIFTLETKNLPILSKIMGWKYGFESPFKADAYFVATRRFTDQKWGTPNPIMLRDREFGAVRVRAFGNYAIQVTDPAAFLRQLVATDPAFETFEISSQLRSLIVTRFSDALASSGIPVLDMAANLDELSKFVCERIRPDFEEMGISVPIFLIENISLPPNVEEALDKRTSMGIIGNLDQYTKFQAAEAMRDAAQNPGSGGAGMGMGLGAGMAMAQQMMNVMGPGQQPAAPGATPGGPPPLPTAVQFFVGINGQQQGPYDAGAIQQLIQAGTLTRETLVWKQGMANWTPAGQVPEVSQLFGSVPPPLPPQ